jgi:hypothetical protein
MPIRPSSSVYSLQEAVGAAPGLAELQARVRASQRCLERVQQVMPHALRSQVAAGPLQDSEWCLLVRSSAAAAKLRQLLPAMREALHESGAQVSAIRIKVQTPGR